MKDIVFMGGKEIGYQCLEYLIGQRSELDINIVAVLANERKLTDSKETVGQLCELHGIPLYPSLEAYEELPDFDILISVQYHEILKPHQIDKAREVAVNLHMAPLPEYRGCNQFSFAILDDAKEFGTTIHQLEEGIDNGAILFEKRFPMPDRVFVKDLYALTFNASVVLFRESLAQIISGNLYPIPQDQLQNERSTSFHLRKEINDIKVIDLNWEKEKIDRHFRATYFPPFEPPYALSNEGKQPLTMEWYQSL